MKKSIYAIIASAVTVISGCSLYSAPWDNNPYEKAPVYKEAKIYQTSPSVVNTEKKAPVLDAKTNTNKTIKSTPTKKASVMKEKVIAMPVPTGNKIPDVSSQVVVERPVKREVMIIPIE